MLQMSPTIAATWLEALGTLIAYVVRTGKPIDGHWDLLHTVSVLYASRRCCLVVMDAFACVLHAVLQQPNSLQLT